MAGPIRNHERRSEALTPEGILDAAIKRLDAQGASGLTFRALAADLATGSGAIYWHIANKHALLAAAADRIVAGARERAAGSGSPRNALRNLASSIFDAIDAHPWLGAQLSDEPWQPAVLQILEGFGAGVADMGVSEAAQFNAATALLSFVLGLAGQYAVGSRRHAGGSDRAAYLREVAAEWAELDPVRHPFVRRMADHLPGHDDREQFLAGIDLILTGMRIDID